METHTSKYKNENVNVVKHDAYGIIFKILKTQDRQIYLQFFALSLS
jgi:hypothetical protein